MWDVRKGRGKGLTPRRRSAGRLSICTLHLRLPLLLNGYTLDADAVPVDALRRAFTPLIREYKNKN